MKKFAVPINESGMLDGHFGHCDYFAIIDTDGSQIVAEQKVTPPPHEPGVLPNWLSEKGVTHVLAGGMGNRAIRLFNQRNIDVFVGAPKMNAGELVAGFLNKTIEFSVNACDH